MEVTKDKHHKTCRGTKAGRSVKQRKEKEKYNNKQKFSAEKTNLISEKENQLSEMVPQTKVDNNKQLDMYEGIAKVDTNSDAKRDGVIFSKKIVAFKDSSQKARAKYRGTRAGKIVKKYTRAKAMSDFLWSLIKNCPDD